jgi:hypothetical protein
LLGSALAVCAGGLGAACVIADPAPEVPVPPLHRPTILHGSVVPPDTQILSEWPTATGFVVPVDLVDPSQPFQYAVFVDDLLRFNGSISPDPTLTDAGIRVVQVNLDPPTSPPDCHRIEFIVARAFNGGDLHTPDSVGGDTVVWFYNPNGDPAGCPTSDAGGLDGAFPPEAGPEAGEGGAGDGGVE